MRQEMEVDAVRDTIPAVGWRSWYLVVLMALSFGMGELSHFLVGTTTRLMAQDLHYGDQSCLIRTNASGRAVPNITCSSYKNETA